MMLSKDEIYKSYNNAKRIQETILPGEKFIKQVIPESFILYLPRDTVSGDFYWIEEVNDTVLFAVADCTGHGVPGAMLTVMCHRAIERSLKEFGMVMPGHILDKTLEILVSDFKKNGQTVADGMDIALCSITGNFLQFSGANNPLWIDRNGILIEIKATKQAIGLVADPAPFVTEELNLVSGDTLYIFSDGFSDQFGGEGDKKFMSSQLRDLLISLNHNTMSEKKDILEKTFMDWKGTKEQTDDVCLMGVRI